MLRNFEIIGEAVKSMDNSAKRKYSAIPWKEIAGFRDILIHHYFGVNWDLVWETINKDLPVFLSEVKKIIANDLFDDRK